MMKNIYITVISNHTPIFHDADIIYKTGDDYLVHDRDTLETITVKPWNVHTKSNIDLDKIGISQKGIKY